MSLQLVRGPVRECCLISHLTLMVATASHVQRLHARSFLLKWTTYPTCMQTAFQAVRSTVQDFLHLHLPELHLDFVLLDLPACKCTCALGPIIVAG